jgi:hypothetical protein
MLSGCGLTAKNRYPSWEWSKTFGCLSSLTYWLAASCHTVLKLTGHGKSKTTKDFTGFLSWNCRFFRRSLVQCCGSWPGIRNTCLLPYIASLTIVHCGFVTWKFMQKNFLSFCASVLMYPDVSYIFTCTNIVISSIIFAFSAVHTVLPADLFGPDPDPPLKPGQLSNWKILSAHKRIAAKCPKEIRI